MKAQTFASQPLDQDSADAEPEWVTTGKHHSSCVFTEIVQGLDERWAEERMPLLDVLRRHKIPDVDIVVAAVDEPRVKTKVESREWSRMIQRYPAAKTLDPRDARTAGKRRRARWTFRRGRALERETTTTTGPVSRVGVGVGVVIGAHRTVRRDDETDRLGLPMHWESMQSSLERARARRRRAARAV